MTRYKKKKPYTIEEFKRDLAKTSPKDFSGETDFRKLTAEEKLLWLSELSRFITKYCGALNKKKAA